MPLNKDTISYMTKAISLVLIIGMSFFVQKELDILGMFGYKSTASLVNTTTSDPVSLFCSNPAKESSDSLLETASQNCRIFGTFTPGNYTNIETLLPDFSANYKAKMENWISDKKSKSDASATNNSLYDKITTLPTEGKIIFSDDINGQVTVKTSRTQLKDNATIATSTENCLIEFKKNDNKWEVENINFNRAYGN